MKEFALKHPENSHLIDTNPSKELEYLISAHEHIKAAVYAPNIAKAAEAKACIKDLELMFEARARAYDYDFSHSFSANIAPNVLLCYEDDELLAALQNRGIKTTLIPNAQVYGGVGELYAKESDEVFSYAIVRTSSQMPALINANDYENARELADKIANLCSRREFASVIGYNEFLCDSAKVRTNKAYCSACSSACPTVAITQEGEINLRQIDCISCARCVAACPSNALDFAPFSRDALISTSELFKSRKIVAGKMPDNLCNALHFDAPIELFDELILLHLVQISEHKLSILGEISSELASRIEFINQISLAIFNTTAIERELKDFARYEGFAADIANFRLNKKEHFARKVLAWLDKAPSTPKILLNHAKSAKVKIAENCTLCAACAAVCKQGALLADKAQNAITFNASLCTGCGYCQDSCAEANCLSIEQGVFELDREFFTHVALARDELFACVECGKEFATQKAIARIAGIMQAHFGTDVLKKYTLFCCADCKGALMMLRQAAVVDPSCFDEAAYAQKLEKILGEENEISIK